MFSQAQIRLKLDRVVYYKVRTCHVCNALIDQKFAVEFFSHDIGVLAKSTKLHRENGANVLIRGLATVNLRFH